MADQFKKQTGEKAKTAVALAYMPGDAAPKIHAPATGVVSDPLIQNPKERGAIPATKAAGPHPSGSQFSAAFRVWRDDTGAF